MIGTFVILNVEKTMQLVREFVLVSLSVVLGKLNVNKNVLVIKNAEKRNAQQNAQKGIWLVHLNNQRINVLNLVIVLRKRILMMKMVKNIVI